MNVPYFVLWQVRAAYQRWRDRRSYRGVASRGSSVGPSGSYLGHSSQVAAEFSSVSMGEGYLNRRVQCMLFTFYSLLANKIFDADGLK